MPTTSRRRAPRATAILCSSLAVCLAALGVASGAQASSEVWGCGLAANGGWCSGNRHSIVRASNSNSKGLYSYVNASTTGSINNLYASWSYGPGYACHPYSGNNLLYPIIMNGDGSSGSFIGGSTFGAGADSC